MSDTTTIGMQTVIRAVRTTMQPEEFCGEFEAKPPTLN